MVSEDFSFGKTSVTWCDFLSSAQCLRRRGIRIKKQGIFKTWDFINVNEQGLGVSVPCGVLVQAGGLFLVIFSKISPPDFRPPHSLDEGNDPFLLYSLWGVCFVFDNASEQS